MARCWCVIPNYLQSFNYEMPHTHMVFKHSYGIYKLAHLQVN